MKPINFINPLPPKRQRELLWWMRLTVIGSFMIIFSVSFTSFRNLKLIQQLKQTKALLAESVTTFDVISEKKQKLTREMKSLHTFFEQIAKLKTKSKKPLNHLIAFAKSLPAGTTFNSLSLSGKRIEIEGNSSTAGDVILLIQRLTASPYFHAVKLINLKQEGDRPTNHQKLSYLIEGHIKI